MASCNTSRKLLELYFLILMHRNVVQSSWVLETLHAITFQQDAGWLNHWISNWYIGLVLWFTYLYLPSRYVAIYLLLFVATLAQYFFTSGSSPGYVYLTKLHLRLIKSGHPDKNWKPFGFHYIQNSPSNIISLVIVTAFQLCHWCNEGS